MKRRHGPPNKSPVADMAHLQRRPRVPRKCEIEALVSRAGTQVRHAAKLWR